MLTLRLIFEAGSSRTAKAKQTAWTRASIASIRLTVGSWVFVARYAAAHYYGSFDNGGRFTKATRVAEKTVPLWGRRYSQSRNQAFSRHPQQPELQIIPDRWKPRRNIENSEQCGCCGQNKWRLEFSNRKFQGRKSHSHSM